MKRVLCISDSLGLPRKSVDYGETWIAMLRERLPDVDFIPLFRRQSNTDILASGGDYGDTLLYYKPQMIILQLGVCDCAPRYLRTTSFLYRLLCHLPEKMSTVCWKVVKALRKRSINRTDVSLERFRLNVDQYVKACMNNHVSKVIIVQIATPGKAMIKSNSLIELSVKRYNQIYEEIAAKYPRVVILINPLHSGDSFCYVADGYHPNGMGNRLVADALINAILN